MKGEARLSLSMYRKWTFIFSFFSQKTYYIMMHAANLRVRAQVKFMGGWGCVRDRVPHHIN